MYGAIVVFLVIELPPLRLANFQCIKAKKSGSIGLWRVVLIDVRCLLMKRV